MKRPRGMSNLTDSTQRTYNNVFYNVNCTDIGVARGRGVQVRSQGENSKKFLGTG